MALAMGAATVPAFAGKHEKVVVPLTTSAGKDAGTATFEQRSNRLKITLALKNLPEGDHAVHIHQHAVCDAPDFKTAGGHFNPEMKQHGLQKSDGPSCRGLAEKSFCRRGRDGKHELCGRLPDAGRG